MGSERAKRRILAGLLGVLVAVLVWQVGPLARDLIEGYLHAPPAPPALGTLRLEPVVGGLASPVHLTHAGDGSGRLFVVEQAGTVRVIRGGELLDAPFLDLRERVSWGGEKGLLSLAFHPRYAENGRLFVDYTRKGARGLETVVSELRVSGADPDRADPASERVVLTVAQPWGNHNGGHVLFGPDGHLYVALGDGGSARDPHGNGQDPHTLLGAILRLDVDAASDDRPYGIPADNPFADGQDGRPEVWAYGLRNPWRLAFDPARPGRLWAADVGQNRFEEVHLVAAGDDCGWAVMEGLHCHQPREGCDRSGLALPVAEYGRTEGASVTGGCVYRGAAAPELHGAYVFTDYYPGRQFFALRETGDGGFERLGLGPHDFPASSFGEDEAGELYVLDHAGGVVHRLAGLDPP